MYPYIHAEKRKLDNEPIVRALIKPALLPLKSLKTSSTVLGGGFCIPSISLSIFSPNSNVSINAPSKIS